MMPIYEFVCQDCGYEFELIQSFSDSSIPQCPVCQSDHVMRRVGRPAIHFKGSGWYITDSKKASKSSANGQNGKDGAEKQTDVAGAPDKQPANGKASEEKRVTTKSDKGEPKSAPVSAGKE
jgi:putative FmdB family regulatory protein